MKAKLVFGLLLTLYFQVQGQAQEVDTLKQEVEHTRLKEILILDSWHDKLTPSNPSGSLSLEEQISQLKGVNLISRGSFAKEVVYRGQSDGRIQVRLNGMRIYGACTDRMDPSTSYVVANNLESVDLSSSCESKCESNGLAGSLNLKTKKSQLSVNDTIRFGLAQSFTSNTKGIQSSFFVERRAKAFSWRLNGTWLKNGNYYDGNNEEVLFSQNEKQNWAFNALYRLSVKSFMRLDLIYDLATDIGYPSLPMDVSKARGIIGGLTYVNHQNFGAFQGFEAKVYHNDIYHEMDDTQREDVFMHMDMPGWSRTSGLSIKTLKGRLGPVHLELYAEYFTNYRRAEMTMFPESGTEPPMFMLTWPDARLHGTGFGVSAQLKRGENLFLSSLRLDYEKASLSNDFGTKQWQGMGFNGEEARAFPLAQLSLSYSRSKKLNASISYGQRAPTTSELYGFYLFNAHDGFDYLGNLNLSPEKLLAAEIGYQLGEKALKLSVNLFGQFYQDYIFGLNTSFDEMTYGARGVRQYENIDNALFWGIEIDGNYKHTKSLSYQLNLDYLVGRSQGKHLPLIPPLQGEWWVNYNKDKFALNLGCRVAAEQNNFSSEYGDLYTPGYAILIASGEYHFKLYNRETAIGLSINNLSNSYYRNHLNWAGIPSMGRNITLNIRFGV